MRRTLAVALVFTFVGGWILAQKKEDERLQNCAIVLKEILDIPDGIPKDILDKAECAVVFPSVKKFALGLGASYGRGAIICRGGADFKGSWGAPAMFALEAGNIGLQLGGQATDFVLLVMNSKGAESVMTSKVKLGADAAAAAGPKGRDSAAATDIVMKAEVLTYSRSRGLFAGVSLEGSTLREDSDANKKVYGRALTAKQIVRENAAAATPAGVGMASYLNLKSPKNLSK